MRVAQRLFGLAPLTAKRKDRAIFIRSFIVLVGVEPPRYSQVIEPSFPLGFPFRICYNGFD